MLRLTRSIYDAVRAHGEDAYPNECCGALVGRPLPDGWEITAAIRAANARRDNRRNRYEIAPEELLGMVGEARRQNLEIAGFYHSHPDHPAQWSPTDLTEAHWLGASYVITEVAHGQAMQTRAFRLAGTAEEDKHFEAEEIMICDS